MKKNHRYNYVCSSWVISERLSIIIFVVCTNVMLISNTSYINQMSVEYNWCFIGNWLRSRNRSSVRIQSWNVFAQRFQLFVRA